MKISLFHRKAVIQTFILAGAVSMGFSAYVSDAEEKGGQPIKHDVQAETSHPAAANKAASKASANASEQAKRNAAEHAAVHASDAEEQTENTDSQEIGSTTDVAEDPVRKKEQIKIGEVKTTKKEKVKQIMEETVVLKAEPKEVASAQTTNQAEEEIENKAATDINKTILKLVNPFTVNKLDALARDNETMYAALHAAVLSHLEAAADAGNIEEHTEPMASTYE
ncbi:hypothetical protein SAMN05192534_10918 [Alteribacillus persepolensis]|uniref:Uncharacterized protein n=1 Tax=Alteribacillus persepolensis TaxID=568899 RepID=A0A1G8EB28_9BACI|nr:hypothetical protein [Alteribacillus persepolensis]SDH67152.1 hypothetical protein SAMN05192534_10918 [Alteribacillus persepolensis]